VNPNGYCKGMAKINHCDYPTQDECWDAWEKRGGREKHEDLCDLHHSFLGERVAFLPHRCDEWEIGDAENVDLLIADLIELRKRMPRTSIFWMIP